MEFIFNFFPRAIFTYNHAVSLLESFTIEIGNLWWVPLNLFEFALMFDGYFFILSFSLSFSDATSSRKQLVQNSLPSNRLGVMLDITKIKNKKVITCAYVLLEENCKCESDGELWEVRITALESRTLRNSFPFSFSWKMWRSSKAATIGMGIWWDQDSVAWGLNFFRRKKWLAWAHNETKTQWHEFLRKRNERKKNIPLLVY